MMNWYIRRGFVALLLIFAVVPERGAQAQTTALATAFTYQGFLIQNSIPVTGSCDLQFSLFTAVTGGTQVGSTQTKTNVAVNAGRFTVQLDFGSVFNGQDRFIAISARCPSGSGVYTALTPRQPITPTPYATSLYGLRVQYNATSPSLLGGASVNTLTNGVLGAVISGGGAGGNPNSVTDNYGTVSGGAGNRAGDNTGELHSAFTPTVGGGYQNTASASFSTVSGGNNNTAGGAGSTVGGGGGNTANGTNATIAGGVDNTATQSHTTVAGGYNNDATGVQSSVGGGNGNVASGQGAMVGGGNLNVATGAYSSVLGGNGNVASGQGAMVGGGGSSTASGLNATIGGGAYNVVTGAFGTIAGGGPSNLANPTGTNNRVTDDYGTVGGGVGNRAGNSDGFTTNALYTTVSGGFQNTGSGYASYVGGGANNTASDQYATISGGIANSAAGQYAVVGGGNTNAVTDAYGTVGGGTNNRAGNSDGDTANRRYATVGGGYQNTASGQYAVVVGGRENVASGDYSGVLGGSQNVASGFLSSVIGGDFNQATGAFAAVTGGANNLAQGSGSQAGGLCARALHNGTFVWGDSQNCGSSGPFATSTGVDQFIVRANGGFTFYTRTNASTGNPEETYSLRQGLSGWQLTSDRNLKENITPIEPQVILDALMQIPISIWNFRESDPSLRNLGPMAQDWHAALAPFGLATAGDRMISSGEMDGVALASIQALYSQMQAKDARIAVLETQVASYEARLAALENLAANGIYSPAWIVSGMGLAGLLAGWVSRRRRQ
jgi:trimeric autotransporter adhesin